MPAPPDSQLTSYEAVAIPVFHYRYFHLFTFVFTTIFLVFTVFIISIIMFLISFFCLGVYNSSILHRVLVSITFRVICQLTLSPAEKICIAPLYLIYLWIDFRDFRPPCSYQKFLRSASSSRRQETFSPV